MKKYIRFAKQVGVALMILDLYCGDPRFEQRLGHCLSWDCCGFT